MHIWLAHPSPGDTQARGACFMRVPSDCLSLVAACRCQVLACILLLGLLLNGMGFGFCLDGLFLLLCARTRKALVNMHAVLKWIGGSVVGWLEINLSFVDKDSWVRLG